MRRKPSPDEGRSEPLELKNTRLNTDKEDTDAADRVVEMLTEKIRDVPVKHGQKDSYLTELANYARAGDTHEALIAIDAMLSFRDEFRERMVAGMDIHTANALQAILARATEEQRNICRDLFREVVQSPALVVNKFFTFMYPYDDDERAASFGQRYMRMIVESVGLPESLISLWERSVKIKIFGVTRNLERMIELEKAHPGAAHMLYDRRGIRFFGRYSLNDLLNQVNEMETQQPYGIWLRPGIEDIRGIFYQDETVIRNLGMELRKSTTGQMGQRLIEAKKKDEACKLISDLHEQYGGKNRISFAIISGHGNAALLQLGEGERIDTYKPRDFAKRTFRTGRRFLEKNATIILQSCKTGIVLAQKLSQAYPDAFVYAPLIATNLKQINVLPHKKDRPCLIPTYITGDLWVLYRGGKLISCQEKGEETDDLTSEKGVEIYDIYGALGEARRATHRSLSGVEEDVFTKRMQSYCALLQKIYAEKGAGSYQAIAPYLNTIADAAAQYLPRLRIFAAQMLEPHLDRFSQTLDDQSSSEADKEESLENLEYYIQCAKGSKREKGLALLNKQWGAIETRIAHFEGRGVTAGRFFATQLMYGNPDDTMRVKKNIEGIIAGTTSADATLQEYFPASEARRLCVGIASTLLGYSSPDTRETAQEIITRLFSDFTELDATTLIHDWFAAAGADDDRLSMMRVHLEAMAIIESRAPGSTHVLYTKYGIRNFGSYPFETLYRQYVEREKSNVSYALLLYPRQNLITENVEHHHYRKLWDNFANSLARKGISLRIAEWENETDIAHMIGTESRNADRLMLAIIGGKGNSQGICYKRGDRWRAMSSNTLRHAQTRAVFAKLKGKTVILDANCAGKEMGFAQELSRRLSCTVIGSKDYSYLGTRQVAHINHIEPKLFYPDRIDVAVSYGTGESGVYRNGGTIKR